MVLGRVITGSPRSESRRALRAVPPPPRQMRASSPSEWKLSTITSRMSIAVPPTSIRWGFSRLVPRMVPPLVRIPDSAVLVEAEVSLLHQPAKPVPEPDDVHVVAADRRLADGADGGVQPGRVAAGGQDADALAHGPFRLGGRMLGTDGRAATPAVTGLATAHDGVGAPSARGGEPCSPGVSSRPGEDKSLGNDRLMWHNHRTRERRWSERCLRVHTGPWRWPSARRPVLGEAQVGRLLPSRSVVATPISDHRKPGDRKLVPCGVAHVE